MRDEILGWIEEDREELVRFLSDFVRARSPNPPGDTTEATAHIAQFLRARDAPFRIIAPQPSMPNVVGTFAGEGSGRHLVLNGHIDVFPVDESERWSHPPWSGAVVNGRIYGRGVVDMKCGTTASIAAYTYLHRLRDRLSGTLTLTAVSDEETFGPWGARYLMEHHAPEVLGDCCLNGEPSGPITIRFGEKGLLWLRIAVRTRGAHGAYTHLSSSATKIAAHLIRDLEQVCEVPTPADADIQRAQDEAGSLVDQALGPGAAATVQRITLNIGTIAGGLKVNMVPGNCSFDADFRLPVGYGREDIMPKIEAVVGRYPEASITPINYAQPKACDPFGDMSAFIASNVQELRGYRPKPILSMGASDARLWRQRGVPAYIYGPFPHGMGQADEYVDIEDFLHVVRVHALSALDYLAGYHRRLVRDP
jgi:succinyl-diaminopimelate desuccinylase